MGRPAKFDRAEVVEKAMNAFWDAGYEATGIADLVRCTSLGPGSIYAAFGSKEALFLESVDRYAERTLQVLDHALGRPGPAIDALRGCLRALVRELLGRRGKRSCLLVNTVLEVARKDDGVRVRVTAHLAAIEARFAATLQRVRAEGDLPDDVDPDAFAALLIVNVWGLRVLGATAASTARVEGVVEQLLAFLSREPRRRTR